MTYFIVHMILVLVQPGVAMAKDMHVVIREINPHLTEEQAISYSRDIYQYATTNYVDPKLVAAIIAKESGFRRDAVGLKGEIGLMQLHPKFHGGGYPESIKDPTANIATGVKYLAGLQAIYGPRYPGFKWTELYNRGPHCKPPKHFPYANAVLRIYKRFGGSTGERSNGKAV